MRLSHPGLLIHDVQDKEVPLEESERLHAKWPQSNLVTVEGLGHRKIIQSERIIAQALAFLKKELP